MAFARKDLGHGIGLRPKHFGRLLSEAPPVDWVEAISENFLAPGGRPVAVLEKVRRDVPVVLHGVSLAVGSVDPLDERLLAALRRLTDRIQPAYVSDHLCWGRWAGQYAHDLLPLPYTEEALAHVSARVRQVQDALGRQILLENVSSYVEHRDSTMPEWEFLARVAREADCGILLDVNNVYVSARNHGFDPCRAIDTLPRERVVQYHLAGFTDRATYLFDTHDAPVSDDVLHLYAYAVATIGPRPTLVEWDAELPAFARLCEEAERARAISKEVTDGQASRAATTAIVADSG